MDNRPLATSSYKEALKLDVYCFEAFDLLTSHHMLTAQEGEVDVDLLVHFLNRYAPFIIILICRKMSLFFSEKDFLESLPLSQQCTEEEKELLHFLFENKLKKVRTSIL